MVKVVKKVFFNMFNGVSDQFHQFIASRTALPLHVSPPIFSIVEPDPSLQIFSTLNNDEKEVERDQFNGTLGFEGVSSLSESLDPWTNEEELALLKIKSSMHIEVTDLLWEHVSRKLEELGFKRSAEKCKEKFEEVSKYNNTYNKSFRFFSELELLYNQGEEHETMSGKMIQTSEVGEKLGLNLKENSGYETLVENPYEKKKHTVKNLKRKKRKRNQKFDAFKVFCEEIVNKILSQQEELHNKLLEDVKRREEERVARQEAWKKQEIARLNMVIETKAQERAIAWDRESKIIDLLKKFTSDSSQKDTNSPSDATSQDNPIVPISSAATLAPQNPDSLNTQNNPKLPTSCSLSPTFQNPNPIKPTSSITLQDQQNTKSPKTLTNPITPLGLQNQPNSISNDREDIGKRWPRDEVNSLISLRCNLYNEDKESTKNIPLWERISQGMMRLGYKRSAKRCKEKWENINKYFKKTKDANKKRANSKTCPYFHQLNSFYNQGTHVLLPSQAPENQSNSPENRSDFQETAFDESFRSGFKE